MAYSQTTGLASVRAIGTADDQANIRSKRQATMAQTPTFYDPERIGTLFYPDLQAIAAEAARAGLKPVREDDIRIHLLLIDMQVTFCHEKGALYVPGALDDLRRLIEFIYRNAERISHITCSLDSHNPFQIFHP